MGIELYLRGCESRGETVEPIAYSTVVQFP